MEADSLSHRMSNERTIMDLTEDDSYESKEAKRPSNGKFPKKKKHGGARKGAGRPRLNPESLVENEPQASEWAFTWSCPRSATDQQLESFIKDGPKELKRCLEWAFPKLEFHFSLERTERKDRDEKSSNLAERWNYHYQGCFKLKDRSRKTTIITRLECDDNPSRLPHIFLGRCHSWSASKEYSGKVGDPSWVDGVWSNQGYSKPLETYKGQDLIQDLLPWQEQVAIRTLDQQPDKRVVNWIYEPGGAKGKSDFVKWMAFNFRDKVLYIDAVDHKDMVEKVVKAGAKSIYLIDLPRTGKAKSDIGDMYNIAEQIKNGMLQKNKYTPQDLFMAPAHVWIFSNNMPDETALTKDRLRVWQIDEVDLNFTNESYEENAAKDARDAERFNALRSRVIVGSGARFVDRHSNRF